MNKDHGDERAEAGMRWGCRPQLRTQWALMTVFEVGRYSGRMRLEVAAVWWRGGLEGVAILNFGGSGGRVLCPGPLGTAHLGK